MTVELLAAQVYTRRDLLAAGLTSWRIDGELAAGRLLRVRRDQYITTRDSDLERAVRIGARLSCVTLLALWGAFVFDASVLHLQAHRGASRLRSAEDGRQAWSRSASARSRVVLHWGDLRHPAPQRHTVALPDALRCAIRCQSPARAVATIDSVLHLGLVSLSEVRAVIATLPARYGVLLGLIDARSEAGTETLIRLMLRQLGADYELQVHIHGVGRVDFVVDGWLIIECDSKAHHEGWEKQQADRRRDLAAARLGFTTIRPLAADILYHPDELREALRDILTHRR